MVLGRQAIGGQTIDGQAFERGDRGYEAARRATVWNARLPDRYPEVIVQATSEVDVVTAIRHAATNAMLVHCAQEMGHLATFLPALHAELGDGPPVTMLDQ